MIEESVDMDLINENIRLAVADIPIVDTHEHIMSESERNEYAVDFSYLFASYPSQDLVSAGLPPSLLEAIRLPMYRFIKNCRTYHSIPPRNISEPEREDMSLEERWQALAPFWEAIRNTAYAKQLLITVRDIFGIDDLNRDTYLNLTQAIAESKKPGWYRYIMKEKANIDISINDVRTTSVDRELFVPVVQLDRFIAPRSRIELGYLEEETGIAIHSVDDLVKAMNITLEGHVKNGAVGLKSWLAYYRTLRYDQVSRNEAEIVYNRIASHLGKGLSWSEAKPLQDYMMHQVIRAAIEAGLPFQLHTGFHADNANIITNSNPTRLVNLFIEYREAKFILFHGGYPYVNEWVAVAKTFPNVYADLCWLYIISPHIGRKLLHELIEAVPGNKIMAFGGDETTVEMAYGHSRMARQVVTRVLSEKVAEGYFKEDEALVLARRILRDNAIALFNLFSSNRQQ